MFKWQYDISYFFLYERSGTNVHLCRAYTQTNADSKSPISTINSLQIHICGVEFTIMVPQKITENVGGFSHASRSLLTWFM